MAYGEPITIAATVIGAVLIPGIATAAQLGKLKGDKAAAQRAANPCIADIDGKIAKLRTSKAKGRKKQIRDLLKQRKQHVANPNMCTKGGGGFQASTATFQPSVPGVTTPAATGGGSGAAWAAGGVVLALVALGAVAALSRKR